MAVLMLAAFVMWQKGELDVGASATLVAFALLGARLILPQAYQGLCMGVFMALCIPWAGLSSRRASILEAVSKSDVVLAFGAPVVWVMAVAWAVVSLAFIALGAWKVLMHHAPSKEDRAER